MKVTIYSRKKIQMLLQGNFPVNTAVISFYDPDKIPVDYNGKAERLIQIPLDDFQTELPQAKEIARLIYNAKAEEINIICQCESGQSRSAGCAAAILEHLFGTGNSIFDDSRYYPDQMVFYKILDALDEIKGVQSC